MFLKTVDWKLIWKFYVTVICGLHFDRTSRIICEKYDEKSYDHIYFSMLLNVYNYWKHWNFEGMKNCNKTKAVSKTKGPFEFNKLLD